MGFRVVGFKYAKSVEYSEYRNISSFLRRIVVLHKDEYIYICIYIEGLGQTLARNVVNPFDISLQILTR